MKPRIHFTLAILLALSLLNATAFAAGRVDDDLKRIGTDRGYVALIGLPGEDAQYVVDLCKGSELSVYFQSADDQEVKSVREAAEQADLLGTRIFVDSGSGKSIHLEDNVADCVLVAPSAQGEVSDKELLRALRPRATAFVGDRKLVKPVPEGIDEWTHPYHGPDNNPQSEDKLVRGNFKTQFLGYPMFSPMPEQTVVAGGRIFKALGHIAHKANQNEWLNTLLCINAYNGTILWKRPLPEGFMIHRNTMIASEDALYMGDNESCKIIDAKTGEVRDEITVPEDLTDGPVWKWMAIKDGTLFALVGNPEIQVDTMKSARRGLGHWPWGMWKGHDYKDPRTSFGFGRTLVAIDLKTKEVLWSYRDEEFLDARGVCMNDGRVFLASPEHFLACIDTENGTLIWKSTDDDLLEAIGKNEKAQLFITGYATSCYVKCNEDYIFFAGPQRKKLVAARADDGTLAWTYPLGNLQVVMRSDGIYAAAPQPTAKGQQLKGIRLDYDTGEVLSEMPMRRACTRATGCADSIFYRTNGGTVRVMTETNTAQHISPMRPPCQDGVIVSNGHLYWGPWMCGCQLSLYGNIALAPVGDIAAHKANIYEDALDVKDGGKDVEQLGVVAGDWPAYRGNNARTDETAVAIPDKVESRWTIDINSDDLITAPVIAGGLIVVADRTGIVRALNESGETVWKTYTAGPVYYPPAIANDRVYVGSADGRVYALEAKTGRTLWTFRVAPEERWIPVYGKLISRWPVAGGVVVEDGKVYAAAGIAHYDGTYVVALDALTGELKAHNDTSGTLSAEVNSGVSMQGDLSIVDGELQFLGGGVYEIARYDLDTLECLNTPKVQVTSDYRTAFYPYYPEYGKYMSIDHKCEDGSTLCHAASYEGSIFMNIGLEPPLAAGAVRPKDEESRWRQRRGKDATKNIWDDKQDRRFTSFIVSGDQFLATGHPDKEPKDTFLVATGVKDGEDLWIQKLPACAVKGGAAIDHNGRIYVSLENGQLMCFAPKKD